MGQAGWPEYLKAWTDFEIRNPTETPGPVEGKFFGQLVTGKISKQEEWGWYCAVWSAFTYWVQTGSRQFGDGVYQNNLLETLDWLERHAYDSERHAFRNYYRGENPYEGTYDFAYDEAVGKPMNTNAPAQDGKAIRYSFNFEANILMYSGYLMLSALLDGEESEKALAKALDLEPFLRKCREERVGRYCIVGEGEEVLDQSDNRWPPCAFFAPDYAWLPDILLHDPKGDVQDVVAGKERFVHQSMINFIMRDPVVMSQDDFKTFMDIFLPQCRRQAKYLQMPGSVIENVNCEDGSYHDNRPQIFATGLMNATMVAQAVRRQPFGIAVRANDVIEKIEHYGFQGQDLRFVFEGEGAFVESVRVGDLTLRSTQQIPESQVEGDLDVVVGMSGSRGEFPVWLGSSLRLLDVKGEGGKSVYHGTAYGRNNVMFDRPPGSLLVEVEGDEVEADVKEANGICYVDFPGLGDVSLTIEA